MRKVLIAAASSGGHIFPALVVAEELNKRYGIRSIFVTTKNTLNSQIQKRGYEVICFRRKDSVFSLFFEIIFNIFHSLSIIRKNQICLVIGFGGYVSIAVIIAGWLFSIPIFIHEQNVRFGRANKFLSLFSSKIALGFPGTAKHKIVYTGNPIREELRVEITREEARKFFGFSSRIFTILAMGGSQGSRSINHAFIGALGLLKDITLQVIHLTGEADFEFVCREYQRVNKPYKVFKFLDEMVYAYNAADLVVSRSGAMTLTEISFFNLAAILIPYPYSRAHQEDNALIFEKNNSAIVIKDRELSAENLAGYIRKLIHTPQLLENMRYNIKRFAQADAAQNIAQQIKEIIYA